MVKELTRTELDSQVEEGARIILYNDDLNTFDWVIQSLVEVCDHAPDQAEQCALIVHYKGKYAVKSGTKEDLHPRCRALVDRGLIAELV